MKAFRPAIRQEPTEADASVRPDAAALRAEIAACRVCAAFLPGEPRPVVQLDPAARILIVSQAPGRLVDETGVSWNDASGARLRAWTGLSVGQFHDPRRLALVAMGMCYPGRGAHADLPPRPECAPLWHGRIMACLTELRLVLLVGQYAQRTYLPLARRLSVTQRVAAFDTLAADTVCLPHPSWRAASWMKRNPWFEAEILPRLRQRVAAAINPDPADQAPDPGRVVVRHG